LAEKKQNKLSKEPAKPQPRKKYEMPSQPPKKIGAYDLHCFKGEGMDEEVPMPFTKKFLPQQESRYMNTNVKMIK
jgi:hypothetical protein